jgi:hypothetical protein
MQLSTLLLTVAVAAAGVVSAEEPTITTTLTSTMTQTFTITSCNPTVKDCPALLASATAPVPVATISVTPVEPLTTSSAYPTVSHSFPHHHHAGNSTAAHTTVRTSVGAGPHATTTDGSSGPADTGLPTGGAAGLRAEHGFAAAVVVAIAALL